MDLVGQQPLTLDHWHCMLAWCVGSMAISWGSNVMTVCDKTIACTIQVNPYIQAYGTCSIRE